MRRLCARRRAKRCRRARFGVRHGSARDRRVPDGRPTFVVFPVRQAERQSGVVREGSVHGVGTVHSGSDRLQAQLRAAPGASAIGQVPVVDGINGGRWGEKMSRFGACDSWLLRRSCTYPRLPRGDGTNAPSRRVEVRSRPATNGASSDGSERGEGRRLAAAVCEPPGVGAARLPSRGVRRPSGAVARGDGGGGIDLLLVVDPKNLNWLIGFRRRATRSSSACLPAARRAAHHPLPPGGGGRAGRPDARRRGARLAGKEPEDPVDVARRVLERPGSWAPGRPRVPVLLPSARDHLKLISALGDATRLDATSLVRAAELVKSPRRAGADPAGGGDRRPRRARDRRRSPRACSEFDVVAELYRSLLAHGSDLPGSPVNFVSGERTCYAHGAPTDRRIRRGDPMISSSAPPTTATPRRSGATSRSARRRRGSGAARQSPSPPATR